MDCTVKFFRTGMGVLDSMRNLLLEWKVKELRKKIRVVWRLALICLFWYIWGERNQRIFQEEEMFDQV